MLNAYSTNLGHAWGVAFNTDAGDFWLSNNLNLGGDDRDYLFLTDGTQTGDTIDDSTWVGEFAADGAYNPRTGMLWRVNVGGDDCVYELDPVAKAATGNRICPDFGTSQRGLAYDPATDTYYAGSWNDGVIHHFDASGTILDSAYVAVAVSGLAFNSSNGRLYAMTNHDLLQGFDVYVFDTRDHYNAIGAFFITAGGTPIMASMGGAGMEIDCNGHLWLVDQVAQNIYEVETDEADVCAFKEIPWLTEDPATGTVPASAALPITCTFDSTGLLPGLRQAQLMFATDTPYAVTPVPVDFTVRFLDVDDASIFQAFIYGAAGAGVMPGCDAAAFQFCPSAQVTRADMAGFILRAVHGAAFVPAPYAGAFNDVHAGDYNADYIQSFFEEGYTVGCGGGNFCPGAVHTRGQTAVFILKGEHGTSYAPPSCCDDARVRRRAVSADAGGAVRRLDRAVVHGGDHGRLRRQRLLSGRRDPERADGDLPRQGVRNPAPVKERNMNTRNHSPLTGLTLALAMAVAAGCSSTGSSPNEKPARAAEVKRYAPVPRLRAEPSTSPRCRRSDRRASPWPPSIEVRHALRHVTSRPLSEMGRPPKTPAGTELLDLGMEEGPTAHLTLAAGEAGSGAPENQRAPHALAVRELRGHGNENSVQPADTTMAVGPNHVLQWVNLSFQVFDKSGASLAGPFDGNTLFTDLGGDCAAINGGDIIVMYDQLADRWFLSQLAPAIFGAHGNHECMAVSTSGDPLGSYYLYDYLYSDSPP